MNLICNPDFLLFGRGRVAAGVFFSFSWAIGRGCWEIEAKEVAVHPESGEKVLIRPGGK